MLSIAGSDPSGGAGIQADLKTFAAWRCYGMAVVTALTAQDTTGVRSVWAPPPEFVALCIDAIAADCRPAAVKTGMLHDAALVETVADRLVRGTWGPVIVDPVMVATSGDRLLRADAQEALVRRLLPLAAVATPNVAEAEALTGRRVRGAATAWDAAARILELGPAAVLLKGGHGTGRTCDDLLVLQSGERHRFRRVRVQGVEPHGAGCTLSAAIAAALAHGLDVADAVRRAGDWVHDALASATPVGRGAVPLDHCAPVRELPA